MTDQIHILGEGGTVFKMDLPLHEAIQDRLTKGYLKRVNADGSPWVDKSAAPAEQPPPYASKKEWVGWAVAESERKGDPLTPDDAEALTKNDLIELYGVN